MVLSMRIAILKQQTPKPSRAHCSAGVARQDENSPEGTSNLSKWRDLKVSLTVEFRERLSAHPTSLGVRRLHDGLLGRSAKPVKDITLLCNGEANTLP